MKIALFVHCFFPEHYYGTETYTLQVAKNLQGLGHQPIVVTALAPNSVGHSDVVSKYQYDSIDVLCIDTTRFRKNGIRHLYFVPELRPYFEKIINEIKPDIAHITHIANHGLSLVDVLREKKIPIVATLTDFFGICLTSHFVDAKGSLCFGPNPSRSNCIECILKASNNRPTKKGVKYKIYKILTKGWLRSLLAKLLTVIHPGIFAQTVPDIVERPAAFLRRYNSYEAAIAPTKFLARAYKQNGLNIPIFNMHFGIDVSPFTKKTVQTDSPLRLGFIGQITAHKGPDILISAFSSLPKGRAHLSIYGSCSKDDHYFENLKRRAKGKEIEFCGTFQSAQLTQVLSNMDFLIIPSRWYENSPLVLLAALATKTPVVVSNVEGMSEFVIEGVNGYLFERGSVHDLERVLRMLIDSPQESRALSETTKYDRSTRVMTIELLEIYQDIVKRQKDT